MTTDKKLMKHKGKNLKPVPVYFSFFIPQSLSQKYFLLQKHFCNRCINNWISIIGAVIYCIYVLIWYKRIYFNDEKVFLLFLSAYFFLLNFLVAFSLSKETPVMFLI